MSFEEKLDVVLARHEELEALLTMLTAKRLSNFPRNWPV